jgi:deoxyribose-phosphate aldolase
MNWPRLKQKHYDAIYTELAAIRSIAPSIILKLILETSQLTSSQTTAATIIAGHANFDFVKTSTGFLGHGATKKDVRLMVAVSKALEKRGVGRKGGMQVKASGGIRTLHDAWEMLGAGAERLGTSGGVWIIKEGREAIHGKAEGERPGMATRLFTDY